MTSRRRLVAALGAAALLAAGCGGDDAPPASTGAPSSTSAPPVEPTSTTVADPAAPTSGGATAPVRYDLRVVQRMPHDPEAFTQGLVFDDAGRLFESTGLEGRSTVRELDPATGDVVSQRELPADEFGEGLAIAGGELVQLTWQDGVARRWSDSLDPLGTWRYEGEGWGLTHDGRTFLRSDGSSRVTRHDTATFDQVGTPIDVTREGAAVDRLNELEWIDGALFTNVWFSDEILRVDPATGIVDAVIDASSLWTDPARTEEMTLNGIAHRPGDPPTRLWVTGKLWPEMFVVDLVAR